MKEHITIIGAGNLTMSIIEAIKRSRAKLTINVVDIDKKKSSQLKKFGIKLNTAYDNEISKSKFILLIVFSLRPLLRQFFFAFSIFMSTIESI